MTTSEALDLLQGHDPASPPDPTAQQWSQQRSRQGSLLHIAGATDGTVQWRAHTMQLVNWGGFEGGTRFDFHPGSTLISGASGTGKSTLLDAYIALMMPSDTPFNGASNDAVGGRARGAEQRNLLSYLRGQTDTTTDEHGRTKPKVLRGHGAATWGAVAMTFINDRGQLFTALRVYYVPARATRSAEITMRMATYDGALTLTDVGQCADSQFKPTALQATFPGLRSYGSYAAFANALHTRLGIGANGDGTKALRLLVRIQAGHQIRTVDELYKQMVLERPATFAAADRAVEHFDELEGAYLDMQEAQAKVDLLADIHALHTDLVDAHAQIEQIDSFGLTRPGDSPATLWALHTERRLLDAAVTRNRADYASAVKALGKAVDLERGTSQALEAVQREHEANGGGTLRQLEEDIARQDALAGERQVTRSDLAAKTAPLPVNLDTVGEFTAAQQAAAAFLDDYGPRKDTLAGQRDVLVRDQYPLMNRGRQIREELASFASRAGLVPMGLDQLRQQAAAAAGIDPADLPFLAELVDIAPGQERWRTAIETVLGASARLLLVPADRLAAFSAAIDPLHLRGRLTFEGAAAGEAFDRPSEPARVAGKLVFADSPFTGWVARHVSDPARNALCVTDSADLAGPGYRVTLAGQTRRGARGTHGRVDTRNIIGFSSADAVADLEQERSDLDEKLKALEEQIKVRERELDELNRHRVAHEAIRDADWDDLDVAAARAAARDLRAQHDRLLAADDKLKVLSERIDELKERLSEQTPARVRAGDKVDEHDKDHVVLVDRQDHVSDEVDRIEAAQRVLLTDAQVERLDAEFAQAAAPGDPGSLDQFTNNLGRLRSRLLEAGKSAAATVERARKDLERTFATYQGRWEDPNLGTTVDSYPDYARILDTTLATGLHERRDEWRRRLTEWSGQDLVPLSGAMDTAVEDIFDRLDPINDILKSLPFGAGEDRLQIRVRRLSPEHVTVFRRELRGLSSAATHEVSDDRLEARFEALRAFMAQIRPSDGPRASIEAGDRSRLLDVRRHVEITAERYSPAGKLLSVHSALGGKSGGESQELAAFIIGAALRFRLGDEDRARPRFAPVFLDEGFVKSDAEFAGRAVRAWQGLGFQLIVGAPLDKVSALEPHMDQLLAITKNNDSHYSFVHAIRDATPRTAEDQAAETAQSAEAAPVAAQPGATW